MGVGPCCVHQRSGWACSAMGRERNLLSWSEKDDRQGRPRRSIEHIGRSCQADGPEDFQLQLEEPPVGNRRAMGKVREQSKQCRVKWERSASLWKAGACKVRGSAKYGNG